MMVQKDDQVTKSIIIGEMPCKLLYIIQVKILGLNVSCQLTDKKQPDFFTTKIPYGTHSGLNMTSR